VALLPEVVESLNEIELPPAPPVNPAVKKGPVAVPPAPPAIVMGLVLVD
jgi:hypothetical protein